jgi:two-component system nitrogen regulation response regulator GlnG/two-component system response regulator HydG
VRRADVRVVAATNRPLEALKHDFAARFAMRVDVPPLDERREDVPLLVRHVLQRAAATHADVARVVAPAGDVDLRRVDPLLIDSLVRHRWRHHARELEELLWRALGERHDDGLRLTPSMLKSFDPAVRPAARGGEPTRADVEASLARHAGNVTIAARELGLKSRYALYRIMRKLGVETTG